MSWTIRSLRLATLPVLALAAASGCAKGDETGNLSVSYSLGFANDCMAFDVPIETVRVTVGNNVASEEAPCNPGEPIELSGVKAGTYDLLVEAIDAEDYVVMDNVAAPQEDDRVEVHGGSSTEVEADLAATPATIRFRWAILVDDFPSMCTQVPLAYFQISAFENGQTGLLFGPHEFECELPEPGYNAVPDPDREINGSDIDGVRVEVQDAQRNMLATVPFEFDPPGPGRVLDFTITCNGPTADEIDCSGVLDVPPGTGGSSATATGGVDTGSGTG